jgi:hypothetical protein
MRIPRVAVLVLAGVLCAASAIAATYKGRRVDGRWFEGRATSTTYGSYTCQVRFDEDHAMVKLASQGMQIEMFLEDEVISDPHDITAYDPRRGVYWTLSVQNLGQ